MDLSENLPPCLSRAAMTSPKFWSMGGDRRPTARTAHSWSATDLERHEILFSAGYQIYSNEQ